MNKRKFTMIVAMMTVLAVSALLIAGESRREVRIIKKGGMGVGFMCGDLTEEQQKKIDGIQAQLDKELVPLQADLGILEAELKKLMVSENPDQGAIDKKLDEIGALMTTIEKARVHNRLKVRKVLTPEQRLQFDRHDNYRCGRHGRGMHHMMYMDTGKHKNMLRMFEGCGDMQGEGRKWMNPQEMEIEIERE